MSDKVGYKSPPKASRFKKGVSGNPSGRPKRPKRLPEEVLAELAHVVEVTEAGRTKRITKQQIVIKALIAAAARGNPRAAALVMAWCESDRVAETAVAKASLGPGDEKLLEDYVQRELKVRQSKGASK